ncbi:phosphate-starvation-inducible PsiE family protein [Hydrogenivirga sp.]
MEKLLYDYNLSNDEIELIRKVKPLMLRFKGEFLNGFYSYINRFSEVGEFLPPEARAEHKEKLSIWYEELFSGRYDLEYLEKIKRIGETHAKHSVPTHYVNASMSYVRRFIHDKLLKELGCKPETNRTLIALDKLLDMNLDVMTSAYRDEEFKLFLATGKVERFFIENLKRFSWFLDIFLIVSLIFSSLLIIYWIGQELFHVFGGVLPLKEGVLSILGSVLILYALSELINEEIKHLRGAPFNVKTFLGVALAAVIREVLILSVSQTDVVKMLSMGFMLLALGLVFWLTSRAPAKAEG